MTGGGEEGVVLWTNDFLVTKVPLKHKVFQCLVFLSDSIISAANLTRNC